MKQRQDIEALFLDCGNAVGDSERQISKERFALECLLLWRQQLRVVVRRSVLDGVDDVDADFLLDEIQWAVLSADLAASLGKASERARLMALEEALVGMFGERILSIGLQKRTRTI